MEIVVAAEKILSQINDLLAQIKPSDYSRPSHLLNSATIGQHVRHSIEFFICLIDGLPAGQVNYDKRRRNRDIEEDPKIAQTVLNEITGSLRSNGQNIPLTLVSCFGNAPDAPVLIQTNYNRELAYNVEHATHHMALIRVAVNEFAEYLRIPDEFGVASSTLRNKALSQ